MNNQDSRVVDDPELRLVGKIILQERWSGSLYLKRLRAYCGFPVPSKVPLRRMRWYSQAMLRPRAAMNRVNDSHKP